MKLKATIVLGILLITVLAATPAEATWVKLSKKWVNGILYVGVLCADGLEGGGTFLSEEAAREAAHHYCTNNSAS